MKDSMLFHKCFIVLQESKRSVLKYFHVAWHSFQLPEQKEGLFPETFVPYSNIMCNYRGQRHLPKKKVL